MGILSLRFSADVTAAIELALAQEAATAGVIAMVIAGPIGVAAAVLILGCRLIMERRRSSLRLLSARGSSTGQLRGMLGLEGSSSGWCRRRWAPGSPRSAARCCSARCSDRPRCPGTAHRAGSAGHPRRSSRRRRPSARRVPTWGAGEPARLIVEGVVVRARGVSPSHSCSCADTGQGGIDPLQAATPLLLSLVACLVTLRVYPVPLGWLFERSRRSTGVTAFLGSARALREPSIGLTPVLALVVGVSVAVSSGVLLSAFQGGVAEAAQAQVGADMRVTGGSFTREQLDSVRAIDGVAAATGISGAEAASLDVDGVKRATSVFVVDAADLRDVQGDGPGMLPPGVSLEPVDGPMPILVAAATAEFIEESDAVRVDATAEARRGRLDRIRRRSARARTGSRSTRRTPRRSWGGTPRIARSW